MDCSGEKLISNAIAQFLPGMLETLKEQQQQNRNRRQQMWLLGGMEKMSLSIFSHLLFPSGMALKLSARVENNISPFVVEGQKGRDIFLLGKNVFKKSYKSFFCCVLTAKSSVFNSCTGRGKTGLDVY